MTMPRLGTIDLHSDRPVYKQIADQLRDAIEGGQLGPGDRLPSEAHLMQHYGVARATARQATGVLQHEGLAVAEHGRGVFVTAATATPSMADMTFSISASGTQEQALASLGKLNLTDELGKA